ncbi:MAG: ABC transporter substrate-binding protein [Rhodobacteraceae bacterium]|nr:ABC transporter substrate-binding protein [Paracoccaceae bacterium]
MTSRISTMISETNLDRRSLVATATAFALGAFLWPGRARAMTVGEARALIQRLVDEINSVIASGRPEAQMLREFEAILVRHGDMPAIARSVLGAEGWNGASAAQQRAYIEAFSGYLARKYGRRFREFIGAEIRVTNTREVSAGVLIGSVANLRGRAPFEVEWLVSDRSGRPRMVNLFIEGINMLATERTEVRAMLDNRRGNIEQLITDLRGRG